MPGGDTNFYDLGLTRPRPYFLASEPQSKPVVCQESQGSRPQAQVTPRLASTQHHAEARRSFGHLSQEAAGSHGIMVLVTFRGFISATVHSGLVCKDTALRGLPQYSIQLWLL